MLVERDFVRQKLNGDDGPDEDGFVLLGDNEDVLPLFRTSGQIGITSTFVLCLWMLPLALHTFSLPTIRSLLHRNFRHSPAEAQLTWTHYPHQPNPPP